MKLSVVVFVALLAGCAHADYAQLADSATTAVALSNGYVEANPLFGGLSWPIIAVVKLGVTQVVKQTPIEICEPGLLGLTVGGYGAALWNIGVMAGSGPAALPVALGLVVWQWDNWAKDAKNTCSLGIVGSATPYEMSDDEYDLLIYK
jgi:hypothetical protein